MTDSRRPCPSCDQPARTVPMTAVHRLVKPAADPTTWGPAWFCDNLGCSVVYFDAAGRSATRAELRVRVFQKETDEQRPVCYCFDHSVADVLAATRPDGTNPVVDAITTACREGRDRCEELNPQGRCCLGNVRGLLGQGATPAACGACGSSASGVGDRG